MNRWKSALAALAVLGFVAAPTASFADPVTDTVEGVGCGVVTIVTLPIKILTGEEPGCK